MIDPEVIPGRMMLLITLFLVVINIFNNLSSNSPSSSGFNAVSAWMFSCLVFVFGALVAYAGILLKQRMIKQVKYLYSLVIFSLILCFHYYSLYSILFIGLFLHFVVHVELQSKNQSIQTFQPSIKKAMFIMVYILQFQVFNEYVMIRIIQKLHFYHITLIDIVTNAQMSMLGSNMTSLFE